MTSSSVIKFTSTKIQQNSLFTFDMACIIKCFLKFYISLHCLLLFNSIHQTASAKKVGHKKFKFPSIGNALDAASRSTDGAPCLTDGCKQAAFYVSSSIDRTVDPCDDFYNFACGGFVKGSKISQALLKTHSRLGDVEDAVSKEIKESLEQKVDPSEPRIFQLAKQFYTACMDLEAIERQGLQPLRDIIGKLGGWPVLIGDAWNPREFSWTKHDVKARGMGFHPRAIFELFIFNDFYNSSRALLYVKPSSPYISSANLKRGWNNTVVKAYYRYMIEVAVLLGADEERAKREMKDVLDFEAKLSLATKEIPEFMKKSNNFQQPYSFKQLSYLLKVWSWDKYMNGLTQPTITLNDKDIIMLRSPFYTYNLMALLKKTPKRVLANYMIWRKIIEVIPHLSSDIREIAFTFRKESTGRDKKPERSRECVKLVNSKKGLVTAVSAFYIRKYFTNETRTAIKPILQSIVSEAINVIQEATWLDPKSKKASLRKVAFMKQIVAFPDELLDDNILNDYIKPLEIHADKHLQNILNINKFHYNYALTGLQESTDKNLWIILSDSTGVNAYYYSLKNIFVLLAGMLQPPLFIPNWPAYAKYGSVGFIIGHEMMHAFDTTNVIFDETGTANPLFTQKTLKKYHEKIECFVNQYNTYIDEKLGLHVDGNLTINENLADNMGIEISYRAYKTWQANHEKELRLPTLKYTAEQIFWITSVGFLCGRMTTKERVNLLLTEVHTPDTFRTRGALSNSLNFAEAFSCKPGTRMNPVDKCSIW